MFVTYLFTLLGIILLFLLGMRLSAFFSGAETGFYRIGTLRLTIDAQSGDQSASRLLWFLHNPGYFVATTLVGNNVANYLTTMAIGLGTAHVLGFSSAWLDISATLLFSPIIFLFGELIPKNLNYRAPMASLRKSLPFFRLFYWLFIPVSLPLIAITNLLQRLGKAQKQNVETTLARNRLIHVINQGEQEGVLKPIQNQLVQGMFDNRDTNIEKYITKPNAIYDVEKSTSREEVLALAHKFGFSYVLVQEEASEKKWIGYYNISEIYTGQGDLSDSLKPMPLFSSDDSKLKVLMVLHEKKALCGLVENENQKLIGIASQRALVEQLFNSRTRLAAS